MLHNALPSRRALLALPIAVALLACDEPPPAPTEPDAGASLRRDQQASLPSEVRLLATQHGIARMPRAPHVRPALAELGRMLAFDPILSGNRDISCMTCHHPSLATGDARHLSIGQGARGLGPFRSHPRNEFIARNAPPLFNLHTLTSLFWDGRVFADESGWIHTPAGDAVNAEMQATFEFGVLSALPLFPVLSREEMRGDVGSPNELAAHDDANPSAVWSALMARLGAIGEYRKLFEAAYPGTPFHQMTFAHASNAIAGFFLRDLTTASTPWDEFLDGKDDAMTREQLEGARNFLSIRCVQCHNGVAFTDNEFHNVAVAQLGPGAGDGPSGRDDFGRFRVTGQSEHRYAFRTTPLRNVELTAPYGHSGAITTVREFIAHYSESHVKLREFDANTLEPLLRGALLPNAEEILLTRDPILDGVVLPDELVESLTAYMTALTDPAARRLMRLVPKRVPSGLEVDR